MWLLVMLMMLLMIVRNELSSLPLEMPAPLLSSPLSGI
jgi:hypothetical protein